MRGRGDRGASALEYAAAIFLAVAVIAGVLLVVIPNNVAPSVRSAVCSIFLDRDCDPHETSPGGTNAGDPAGNGTQPGSAPRSSGPPSPGATPPGGTAQPSPSPSPRPAAGAPADRGDAEDNEDDGDDGDDGGECEGNLLQRSACRTGDFLGSAASGTGNFVKGLGLGAWDSVVGVWDGVTFVGCLVHICSHDGFKSNWGGLKELVTNPRESLAAIWDDATKDCREFFDYAESAGRCTTGIIGTIVGGKGINKLGKLNKLPSGRDGPDLPSGRDGPDVDLPPRLGTLTQEARDAADRATEAADEGDWVTARSEADLARQKLDDADAEAAGTGCRVGSLGSPGRPAVPAGALILARTPIRPLLPAAPPTPCEAATSNRTTVEEALRDAADARMDDLRGDGPGAHGVQRHLDAPDAALQRRLGEPQYNPDGTPVLYGPNSQYNGLVKGDPDTFVDPMNPNPTRPDGSTNNDDMVNAGQPHRVGAFSSAFGDPLDLALADMLARRQLPSPAQMPTGTSVTIPISELGADAHQRMRGFYRDPTNPTQFLPIDFEGGEVVAVYRMDASGKPYLYTMYPNPAPGKHP